MFQWISSPTNHKRTIYFSWKIQKLNILQLCLLKFHSNLHCCSFIHSFFFKKLTGQTWFKSNLTVTARRQKEGGKKFFFSLIYLLSIKLLFSLLYLSFHHNQHHQPSTRKLCFRQCWLHLAFQKYNFYKGIFMHWLFVDDRKKGELDIKRNKLKILKKWKNAVDNRMAWDNVFLIYLNNFCLFKHSPFPLIIASSDDNNDCIYP